MGLNNGNHIDELRELSAVIHKKPKIIGIELTTFCPLDCIYCSRHESGDRDKEMAWNDFIQIKCKLEEFDKIILCGVGEPLIYSKIYEVVYKLRNKQIIIITSGAVPIDFEILNKYNNVKVVSFSVDAPNGDEMKKIASKYNWDTLIDNLKPTPFVFKTINCTVGEHNYIKLPEIAKFAVKNKVLSIKFTMENIHVKKDRIFYDKVVPYLEEAKKIVEEGGVIYSDSFTEIGCTCLGNIAPYIKINGDVVPCCHGVYSSYFVGNIFVNTFNELWESEKYKSFVKGNLCVNNCWLYDDRFIGKYDA